MIPTLLALLPALLSPPSDVSVFVGPPPGPGGVAGPGDVVVLDPSGIRPPRTPPALQGVELLGIDAVGRTALDRLRTDRTRRFQGPGEPARLELANGGGSLYHYRRARPGGFDFGYLWIGPGGVAATVLERPGTGLLGSDDPFRPMLAVSPDGAALLLATTLAAGGDLLEMQLASGALENRTPHLPPREFLTYGLCLAGDWGLALSARGPLRFERQPGARATFPGVARRLSSSPSRYGDGIALSAAGSTMGFVGIVTEGVAYVQLLQRTGPIRLGCATPGPISGAGYLPGSTVGPTLALAPDGSCVAWRTEGASREAWVAATPPAGTAAAPAGFQITADERFVDTLSETGVIGFLSPNLLQFAVGEPNGILKGGGVGSADLYRLELSTGALRNVSGTSGDLTAPFLAKGEIETADGLWDLGVRSLWMAEHADQGVSELLAIDTLAATSTPIVGQLKNLDRLSLGPAGMVLVAERSFGNRPTDVLTWDPGSPGAPATLHSRLMSGCLFVGFLPTQAGFAGVLECGPSRWFGRVQLAPPGTELLTSSPRPYGTTLADDGGGGQVGVTAGPLGQRVFSWDALGVVRDLFDTPSPVTVLR